MGKNDSPARRARRTRNAARALSKRGYIVHELCGPDHNCGSPGKVPHSKTWNDGGVKDRDWIADAFRRRGKTNIGLRCVPELLILDCDVHAEGADGFAELVELYAANGMPEPAQTALTGSGGVHVWLRVPDDVTLACNRKLLPNVDTRTGGVDKTGKLAKVGQVVIPPSLHASGHEYQWASDLPPGLDELTMAPAFVLEPLIWTPPPTREAPTPAGMFETAASDDGFDPATAAYWRRAVDGLATHQIGGDGRQGRNTALFALGATARALTNAVPTRAVPPKNALMADAIAAAEKSGLDDDLERQFENGWEAAASEANWPPSIPVRNQAAAERAAAQEGS